MENMKSLADQLRNELIKPKGKEKIAAKKVEKELKSPLLETIIAFDNSMNKSMVHVRFDEKTVKIMNQFKMATNVDVTKLVAFSVKQLFESNPELKTIIKQFIQNTEL